MSFNNCLVMWRIEGCCVCYGNYFCSKYKGSILYSFGTRMRGIRVPALVWLSVLAAICVDGARGFPTLHDALNDTNSINATFKGIPVRYMPVYTTAVIDRILSVTPQTGQFSAVIELFLEWNDLTAFSTMQNSTSRMRGTDKRCVKPCVEGNYGGLCCDDVFSVNVQFSNAASIPDVVSNLYFGENGTVRQLIQVYGTFYQNFRLKDYPFSYLPADISFKLNTEVYSDPNYVNMLPIPIAAAILGHTAGQGSSGWFATDPVLRSNKPGYRRRLTGLQNITNGTDLVDFRGATIDQTDILRIQESTARVIANMIDTEPLLDLVFFLYVGSVQAFSLTLPLVLLALLNLAVFLLPLSGLANRVQFCITLFFTTSATLYSQSFNGSEQLNSVQRLAIVIFTMLTFTVFASILNHGLNIYTEGKIEMKNDFQFIRRGKKANIVAVPKESPNKDFPYEGNGTDLRVPQTFGERFRDDKEFRLAFVKFLDRLCLMVTFLVYLISFSVICTDSSKEWR